MTCKDKCIDVTTHQRYGFDPVTKECLCPSCKCKCDIMFTVDAFTAVPLRALLESGDVARTEAMSAQATQARLSTVLQCHSRLITRTEFEHNNKMGIKVDNKQLEETIYQKTMEAQAMSCNKLVDSRLDRPFLDLLRADTNKPTTKVAVR